ncbi:hypothetical protein CgunFtcFv8_009119 [Champsocephalus gunnari]|uniref:Uncharacterized protein n=1 Tax=Champsocephalus gunnari TaxID=52237 RepID=A0AAN8DBJ4_CHAGU|nr:hypothetical protein CgunFtcFv8_009119 [Champsocephalus gunnari]
MKTIKALTLQDFAVSGSDPLPVFTLKRLVLKSPPSGPRALISASHLQSNALDPRCSLWMALFVGHLQGLFGRTRELEGLIPNPAGRAEK